MSACERTTAILEAARDDLAGYIAVSDNDHKLIHEGRAFSVKGNTGSLTAGSGVYYVTFKTAPAAAKRFIHLRPTALYSTANVMLMELHEGSAVTTLGTQVTPLNMNRNLQATHLAQTLVYVGSSTVTDGTQIVQSVAGAGGGANNSGGGSGTIAERVLLPGTTYTLKISNIGSSTASTGYFELYFYEEARAE